MLNGQSTAAISFWYVCDYVDHVEELHDPYSRASYDIS